MFIAEATNNLKTTSYSKGSVNSHPLCKVFLILRLNRIGVGWRLHCATFRSMDELTKVSYNLDCIKLYKITPIFIFYFEAEWFFCEHRKCIF